MMDNHYPSVDIEFLVKLLDNNPKVQGTLKEGKSTFYIIQGTKPIGERICIIREVNGEVDFDMAMSIVTKLKCIGDLLLWLEEKKGWKDGAYFVKK